MRARPIDGRQGLLCFSGRTFACALGRRGLTALKREGDGATPLGRLRVLGGYRRDGGCVRRTASRIALRRIRPEDGWCDAPGDRNYNRPVRLPYPASAECMRRTDRLYDVCVVLDYNTRPRRRGAGSAIFLHVAKPGLLPTEGCIAVAPALMAWLLPRLSPRSVLVVRR